MTVSMLDDLKKKRIRGFMRTYLYLKHTIKSGTVAYLG